MSSFDLIKIILYQVFASVCLELNFTVCQIIFEKDISHTRTQLTIIMSRLFSSLRCYYVARRLQQIRFYKSFLEKQQLNEFISTLHNPV